MVELWLLKLTGCRSTSLMESKPGPLWVYYEVGLLKAPIFLKGACMSSDLLLNLKKLFSRGSWFTFRAIITTVSGLAAFYFCIEILVMTGSRHCSLSALRCNITASNI